MSIFCSSQQHQQQFCKFIVSDWLTSLHKTLYKGWIQQRLLPCSLLFEQSVPGTHIQSAHIHILSPATAYAVRESFPKLNPRDRVDRIQVREKQKKSLLWLKMGQRWINLSMWECKLYIKKVSWTNSIDHASIFLSLNKISKKFRIKKCKCCVEWGDFFRHLNLILAREVLCMIREEAIF